MRGDLVALDLETTGLDIESDSIIEIGAVRMRNGHILDEYATLVNPGFVIPAETTHITGIHQDDLRQAPLLTEVLSQITEFVGQAPVIAHNVSFDIGFMQRFGILKDNLPIDTFELASILLPRVPRYSLSSLSELLNIDLENAHRALDDARASALLYWHLWEKARALPYHILYEISTAAKSFQWQTGAIFHTLLEEAQDAQDGSEPQPQHVIEIFQALQEETNPLEPNDSIQKLELDKLRAVIDENSSLARAIEHYEVRPQQIHMAHLIAEAFNNSEHLIIEAGTGTGKSIAYLLPAIQWATKNNQRVVISTKTINLQDQLLNKDIPIVSNALKTQFRATVMKGRGNYLCPRRLAALRRRKPNNIDELRTLAKILVWLQESPTGDRGEISLRSGEYFVWNRMSAEDEGCHTHRCLSAMQGTCPYYKARKQAEAAHIVIANHALLISDTLADNRVLPEYHYLIVDEAHQLEDAITNGLSLRIDQNGLLRRLNELGSVNSGALGDILRSARDNIPDKQVMRLEVFIQTISEAVRGMSAYVRHYFNTLYQYIQDTNVTKHHKIRIDAKKRGQKNFSTLKDSWIPLSEFFAGITDAMQQLAAAINQLSKYEVPGLDDHFHTASAAARNLDITRQMLHEFTVEPDSNTVYWINNANAADYLSVQCAPLHVGPMMESYLWHTKESIILTSATLQTTGSFEHLQERLYGNNIQTKALGSPFDYKQSTLVFIPEEIAMPHEHGYQNAVERGIVELAAALNGRVLVLFTSYAQLRETAAKIAPRLALGNITVYDQITGGSREALLDSFKSTEKAVLLGTRSFWEGVDIPGDDLSALVMVRLPFAVPNDPVFAARSATYSNAFMDFAVPDAILRFRQGFGRLIRTKLDRGIVAIFDSRVIQKSYGSKFLESLPDCTIQYGQLSDLPTVAIQWLNR